MEMLLTVNDELHFFKRKIPEKMKQWPFYHINQKDDEQYVYDFFHEIFTITKKSVLFQGSLYSPFLHDAVYLYGLALNKTLEKGGSISDGKTITANSKGIVFRGLHANGNEFT